MESGLAVRQVFGREPTVEDGRYVGRWAYASAWLATDMSTARELVRARLALAAEAAVGAAMGAGRGDAERFLLVSALARLPEAIEAGSEAVERAVEAAAARLVEEGRELRAMAGREQTAFARQFRLEAFGAALREVGSDRNVLLREVAEDLDMALGEVPQERTSLRTLRHYLRASLARDAAEASLGSAAPGTALGLWLTADLALVSRKAHEYAAAWSGAARVSGDALSKLLAGLAAGTALPSRVVEALADDPWALVYALAMTTEPLHASAALECAAQAQVARRARAARGAGEWAALARRADDLEARWEVPVLVSFGDREPFAVGNLDLFAAWGASHRIEDACAALRGAMERAMAAESARRHEAVRRARASLETLRGAHEAAAGRVAEVPTPEEEEPPLRGCATALAVGCSVMATYAAWTLLFGGGGALERLAPWVLALAAAPVAMAIVAQAMHGIRQAGRAAEYARRRAQTEAAHARALRRADEAHGGSLAQAREALEEAEGRLGEFEREAQVGLRVAA